MTKISGKGLKRIIVDMPSIFLKSEEIITITKQSVVITVLGSCISATLYHPQKKIGMINHALLPADPGQNDFKYVDSSIRFMADHLLRKGIHPNELEVKLFGGARQSASGLPGQGIDVGGQNIKVAVATLLKLGFSISASDTGGCFGRKIFFIQDNGKVYTKMIKNIISGDVSIGK
ncbi:MAG: chemotaxis protein CheD [Proteobacteria bacterium]|nr:chemotaxis protein CheD [Pseudomonadota bacterium]